MVNNFSVSAAVWVHEELQVLITLAHHNKEHVAKYGHDKVAETPKAKEAIKGAIVSVGTVLKSTASLLQLMKSAHIEAAADRLRSWTTDDSPRWDDLFTRACTLRDAIKIEFKEYLFYAYPKDKGQKFTAWKGDWEKVSAAFPETQVDSYCATDCYGLGHNTASVFHSMRVAEIGLRALAGERRIKLPKNKAVEWATWQEIIKALDDEIKLIGQTWKAGSRKDAALEFYSGARADLNGFKDEYRNLVMHVRLQYDEFQAARALARVHDFMGRLAAKIDHKHQRIKWGRAS